MTLLYFILNKIRLFFKQKKCHFAVQDEAFHFKSLNIDTQSGDQVFKILLVDEGRGDGDKIRSPIPDPPQPPVPPRRPGLPPIPLHWMYPSAFLCQI